VSWNTREASNGIHTLTAVARDGAGKETTASTSVTVANDTTAPVVAITSPVPEGVVAGVVAVLAQASDDTVVVGVRFELDGAPLGVEDTTAPYEFLWNAAAVPNGTHTLSAVARDADGHQATAPVVVVTVANDITPPTVAMTGLVRGALSGTVTIAADAADDFAVAGVQFLLDGESLGAELTSAPYQLAWATESVANGYHTLTAVARDTAGHQTTATIVNVIVANDTESPP
jgi:hypothetical protein